MEKRNTFSGLVKTVLPYLIAIIASFAAAGIFIAAMGFNVWQAYRTILFTSFRTPNGFIQTLLKFVPLTLQALAFTVPLAAGKYNIGGEGQMVVGAIGAATAGILFPNLPPAVLIPVVLLAGIISGMLWGLIPGWLLYKFSINEILTTVILNFVAFQLIDYVCTGPWRDATAGHPMTINIGENGFLPLLVNEPPLHIGVLIVILVAIGVYIFTSRTSSGYELVATGANPRASQVFGINTKMWFVLSLVIAGGLGGLSGAIEVAGVQHRLIEGIQSNFLVLGLIIGLISKGNNAAVPFVAFFIAVLEVGASAMQRVLMIPVEMVFIVEALVLLFVLLSDVVRRRS